MATRERADDLGSTTLPIIHRHAAAIDIGSRFHVVAVPPDADGEPVRTFLSFTGDLHRLADWLAGAHITTVAMESTSVYWIPVFEILEARGFEVLLVNARDARNVPGRKTDVNDAQWLQRLHQHGLLRGSFRPHESIAALRAYLRHRERLVEYAASHVQHMQKSLMQMNVQLHHVVSDITGMTGMRIIRSILGGERDPATLAQHRDVRCKATVDTIRQSLTGNYRPEHVFTLGQAVELYDAYQSRIRDCDREIERCLRSLNETREPPATALPEARTRSRPRNEPAFEIRPALYVLAGGVDLTQIHGLGPYSALRIVAECGTDMSRWRTSKHFTSWLTLAPGSKISGGRVLSSRTRRSANRAAALLRTAAVCVGKTRTALGAFFRRLAARVGKAKAITATARKIAVLFYNTLRYGAAYVDPGVDYYEERFRRRTIDNLRRRADALGFRLVETQPIGEGVS
ncbi:MAG: IS110 family transposase [Planctomycetaceae bacterium]